MLKSHGQGLVEYALILVVIAIVIIGLITLITPNKPCAEGYFWSYKERACLPGYRPQ